VVPQQLDQRFNDARPFLVTLKDHVAASLTVFADAHNYPFTGRIKTVDSVAEKIEMGRYPRFSEIDDLVGFIFVIPTATVEEQVREFCRATFEVIAIRDKRTAQKAPDVFRYDSTRVIARARRPADLVDRLIPSIYDYLFEIQVRTAFEHAWSVATHDLVYKTKSVDWKRIRLAAQLKASSEGLDAAVAAFEHLAHAIDESPWSRVSEQLEVSSYIADLFDGNRVPGTLKPTNISRFCENFCTLVRAIRPTHSVGDLLKRIDDMLNQMQPDGVPVSLSLYQLFLGIICEQGLIGSVQNLSCHITPELQAMFPRTNDIRMIFDYNS
jgi:ppGpp synthetase/RelA/SpoT-type nucleotidyltranferase